jgi:hypothetical protein
MTKKTSAVLALLVVGKAVTEELRAEVTSILEAKGSKKAVVNLDEIRKVDKNGKVTEIKCSVSGVWLPATEEFFYVNKKGDKNLNNLLRRSRQAEKIYKDHSRNTKAAKAKIWEDFENNKINGEQAKSLMKKIPLEPDYTKVTRNPQGTPSKEENPGKK